MTPKELREAAELVLEWERPRGPGIWTAATCAPTRAIRHAGQDLARAYLAEHPEDDDEPLGFNRLVSMAVRMEQADPDYMLSGVDVWWEIGPLSFTCESYQSDPGESVETVAVDWQIGDDTLPNMLIPKTVGQLRRLLDGLGIKQATAPAEAGIPRRDK